MFKFNDFYQDDKVTYVGARWAKELAGKEGWVVGQVKNEPGVYVVEFEGDSFIMPTTSLAPFKGAVAKDGGIEVRQFRKRHVEDEK